MIVKNRLNNFPISPVKLTNEFSNKAFHGKIFTLFASSETCVYTFSKRHSPHYDFCFCFFKDDEGQWYLEIDSMKNVRKWVISQAKNPKVVFNLYKTWKKDWEKYLKLAKKLDKKDLSKISDKELYKLFEEFYLQYLLVGSTAYMTDSFMSTGAEDWLESLILKELPDNANKMDFVRDLTSPVHLSFILEAEYKLLKIALKVLTKFPNKLPSLNNLKKNYPEVYRDLKRYENNFHWINNNYYNVHYIDVNEVYEKITKIINEAEKNKNTLKRLLDEKESELENVKNKRKKLIESLPLSDFMKNVLDIAMLFSKWKDIRKSGVLIGMCYFDMFLEEISKRVKYTKKQLTFTIFDEIKGILLDKKDMKKEISKRQKKCFFAVTTKGYYIVSGEGAQKYFKYSQSEDNKNVTEIRGVVASTGHARGRVRIIKKTHEMKDFKNGEILVTNQTTPEFVSIMKKAAAIITEQGGITSHAAVISRELGIPCIIGTKNAASVLINGETVEVDCEKGIIRRER